MWPAISDSVKTDPEKNGVHPFWIIGFSLLYFLASWIYYPFSLWINTHFNQVLACKLVQWTGLECPTCGASRSAYYFTLGKWGTSFFFHPSVFLASLYVLSCLLWALFRWGQGRRIQMTYSWNTCFAGFLALVCLFFWTFKGVRFYLF